MKILQNYDIPKSEKKTTLIFVFTSKGKMYRNDHLKQLGLLTGERKRREYLLSNANLYLAEIDVK